MSPLALTKTKTYYPRLGKISAGYKTSAQRGGKTVTFPVRSEAFVFRSNNKPRLEAVARVLGGVVERSPDPDQEGPWRVITQAKAIEVVIVSNDERGWSGQNEFWGKHGKLRQCDGTTCEFAIDPATGERRERIPCVCRALGLEGDEACKTTTRLNVLIPALIDVPGIGIWQVESRGKSTWMAERGTMELLQATGGAAGIPLTLAIEIRQRLTEAGLQKWPALVLHNDKDSFPAARERAKTLPFRIQVDQVPPPDVDTPPLGAGMTAEEIAAAAEYEAAATPALPVPVPALPAAPTPGAATPPGEPTVPGTPSATPSSAAPAPALTADVFWKTARRAAAATGTDAMTFVGSRTGGVTDYRQIDSETRTAIYQSALAALANPAASALQQPEQPGENPTAAKTATAPSTAPATPPSEARPKPRATLRRDSAFYTTAWQLIGAAAARENDPAPHAWLARTFQGRTNLRDFTDEEVIAVTALAKDVADGRARTVSTASQMHAADGAQPPAQAPAVHGEGGRSAAPASGEQIDTIEQLLRQRRVTTHQRTDYVRWASANRAALLGHLTAEEASRLITRLREGTPLNA